MPETNPQQTPLPLPSQAPNAGPAVPAWAQDQSQQGDQPLVSPDQAPDTTMQDAGKSLMQAGGGVVGATLGLAGGPVGAVVGGALGAMVGTQLANVVDNVGKVVAPIKGEAPQSSLSQDSIDMLKSGALSIFGAAGAEMGPAANLGGKMMARFGAKLMPRMLANLNPAIINSVLGGGVGAMTGSITADQAQTITRLWRGIPPDQQTVGMLDQVSNAVVNGGLDVAFGTAGSAIPGGFRGFLQKVWGITPRALELFQTAKAAGIDLNIANVSENEVSRGFLKILGVMPGLNMPYTAAVGAQEEQMAHRVGQMVEGIAGGSTPTRPQLSKDTMTAADKNFQVVTDQFNKDYDELLARAKVAGPIVPTTVSGKNADGEEVMSLQGIGQAYLSHVKASTMPQMTESPTGSMIARSGQLGENISADKQAVAFAQRLTNLPKVITVQQASGLLDQLDTLFARAQKDGTQVYELAQLKDGVRYALTQAVEPNTTGRFQTAQQYQQGQIGRQFNDLDQRWSKMRQVFESPTAQKFNTVTRNMFRIALQRPGTRTEDTIGDLLWNMNSPDQVEQLRSLVGDDLVHKGFASFLEQAHLNATKNAGINAEFDPVAFQKELGMDNPKSAKWQAVQSAMDGSGYSPQMLQNFVKGAIAAKTLEAQSSATMVARRWVLGGFVSALHAILPVGGALEEGGLGAGVGALAGVVTAYKGAQILSSPRTLQWMINAQDNALPLAQRKANLIRVLRVVLGPSPNISEDKGSQDTPSGPPVPNWAKPNAGNSSFLLGQ